MYINLSNKYQINEILYIVPNDVNSEGKHLFYNQDYLFEYLDLAEVKKIKIIP